MKYNASDIPPTTSWRDKLIVRGDRIAGGLKRPVLEKILTSIKEDAIIYPGDGYGSAGEALALACLKVQKKLHLILPDTEVQSETLERTKNCSNVTIEVAKGVTQQIDLVLAAEQKTGFQMPIGCRTPDFCQELKAYLAEIAEYRKLETDNTTMWYTAGSGTLGTALKEVFPKSKLAIANLGFPQLNLSGHVVRVHNVNRSTPEQSPIPTNSDYDRHMWPIVNKQAQPGDIVWNYAQ